MEEKILESIIHGMEEHQEKNETNALVIGYFSKKDEDKLLIEDERVIRE